MPHPDPKTIEQEDRGKSVTYYSEDCAWKDNKAVYVSSDVHGVGAGDNTATRYSKTAHKKVSIQQPDIIKSYNKMMGGVDLLDQQIGFYRPRIRKSINVGHCVTLKATVIMLSQGWNTSLWAWSGKTSVTDP